MNGLEKANAEIIKAIAIINDASDVGIWLKFGLAKEYIFINNSYTIAFMSHDLLWFVVSSRTNLSANFKSEKNLYAMNILLDIRFNVI